MILEAITFALLGLVLALKYGSVTRMVKLRQRLRDAEVRCLRQKEQLKHYQSERRVMEREESGLVRQRTNLEDELRRLSQELEGLKLENSEMVQELVKKNARVDPGLRDDAEADMQTEEADDLRG